MCRACPDRGAAMTVPLWALAAMTGQFGEGFAAEEGVVLLGHLQGYGDGKLFLAADLEENLANGDEALTGLLKVFDEYIRKTGIDAPQEPPRDSELPPPIPSGGSENWISVGPGSSPSSGRPDSGPTSGGSTCRSSTNAASQRTAGVSPRSPASPSLASSGCTSGSRPSSTASRRTPPIWPSTSPQEYDGESEPHPREGLMIRTTVVTRREATMPILVSDVEKQLLWRPHPYFSRIPRSVITSNRPVSSRSKRDAR